MKFLLLCVLACAGVCLARKTEHYIDIYDNIDIKEVISNRRMLVPYVLCVLGEQKCTGPGKELKKHIKEALETRCAKCTEAQQKGSRLIIGHLINHEKNYWKKLTDLYDPDRKFTAMYEKELKEAA